MQILQSTIQNGWPDKISEAPKEIQQFCTYRVELSEADGIVLKGEKIVIPKSLRKEMLSRIHSSHLGVNKCRERAKDVLFWPGMWKQIEEAVTQCEICQEHQMSNTKEPMIMGTVPSDGCHRSLSFSRM